MKSLVFGGNGFIGSHLVDKLLSEGHSVRVFDKSKERYRLPLPDVEYIYGDFSDSAAIAAAVKGVDTVFHCLSTSLPKTSNEDMISDISSNLLATISMLEQCVKESIRKLVFISSGGTVYGNPSHNPVAEDHDTNPECSYGIVKLAIEKYLFLYNHKYNLNYVILRPSNPYGSRQNPNGEQGAIAVFLGRAAKGEPIEVWGSGETIRDYIYINDLVEGIYRASVVDTKSTVFNLGSGVGVSLNELLAVIGTTTSVDIPIRNKAGRFFDVSSIYLNISRAVHELSWEPATPLAIGVEKTWDFVRHCSAQLKYS